MQGEQRLWLPGTDHAGIATQNVVEQDAAPRRALTAHDLGREEFLERVWEWKEEYGGTIIEQLKRLGCSCDWTRERFTMDAGYVARRARGRSSALYEKGLIYRGKHIVNWCPRCRTALSDDEVEHRGQRQARSGTSATRSRTAAASVIVATTRPETMLGDTAVAVHPDDERYSDLVGKTLVLPLLGREIPIIADERVDPEFGTGARQGHARPRPQRLRDRPSATSCRDRQVIGQDGRMHRGRRRVRGPRPLEAPQARGRGPAGARAAREDRGLRPQRRHCDRCHTRHRAAPREQWFVRHEGARRARDRRGPRRQGQVPPERWENVYLDWMENIRDWCISPPALVGPPHPGLVLRRGGEITRR